jgi:uncharacterized sporulation protein YeaH/YhbH (DUF444 family)
VRLAAFWIDMWLRAHYKNIAIHYIVHDAAAREVDQHAFYHMRESGGTKISSAYALAAQIIEERYNPLDWNLYAFHFSDGENFGGNDDKRSLALIEEALLPAVNLFAYGQVKATYGKQFIDTLKAVEDEKLVKSRIEGRDDIYTAIKAFLGKGY